LAIICLMRIVRAIVIIGPITLQIYVEDATTLLVSVQFFYYSVYVNMGRRLTIGNTDTA